jgi:hypothetical protein
MLQNNPMSIANMTNTSWMRTTSHIKLDEKKFTFKDAGYSYKLKLFPTYAQQQAHKFIDHGFNERRVDPQNPGSSGHGKIDQTNRHGTHGFGS